MHAATYLASITHGGGLGNLDTVCNSPLSKFTRDFNLHVFPGFARESRLFSGPKQPTTWFGFIPPHYPTNLPSPVLGYDPCR
jgi:hypothetical protein